ncbi:MAG: hypothetical protein ACPGSM_01460 [Thiolinea sp.]
MAGFIEGIFTFPTVFYGGLLVLVVLYWLSAIFGIAEVDSFDGDMDLEAEGDASGLSGWLTKFKLDGIPLTITLSLIILASWVLCFVAVHYIYHLLPAVWIKILVGFWLLLIAPVIAAVLISPILQPLKPLFKKLPEQRAANLVGQYAVIRTGKVTATMGEADFQDGGAGLILKVRAAEPNAFKRGDRVKLKSYDIDSSTYQI